ncbi:MAG: LOG family protein [Bacteroidales bacterium]
MRVCVFAASSNRIDGAFAEAAEELGCLLAKSGMEVIYGGGGIGLMGKLADAVIKSNGRITGVIPRFMKDEGWGHNGITEMIVTADLPERKNRMIGSSDAIVALPGGIGTIEELTEAITLKQLGFFRGPVVILNTLNYYSHFLKFLRHMISGNFMRQVHGEMWSVADKPAEVIKIILDYKGWYENPRRFAKFD